MVAKNENARSAAGKPNPPAADKTPTDSQSITTLPKAATDAVGGLVDTSSAETPDPAPAPDAVPAATVAPAKVVDKPTEKPVDKPNPVAAKPADFPKPNDPQPAAFAATPPPIESPTVIPPAVITPDKPAEVPVQIPVIPTVASVAPNVVPDPVLPHQQTVAKASAPVNSVPKSYNPPSNTLNSGKSTTPTPAASAISMPIVLTVVGASVLLVLLLGYWFNRKLKNACEEDKYLDAMNEDLSEPSKLSFFDRRRQQSVQNSPYTPPTPNDYRDSEFPSQYFENENNEMSGRPASSLPSMHESSIRQSTFYSESHSSVDMPDSPAVERETLRTTVMMSNEEIAAASPIGL